MNEVQPSKLPAEKINWWLFSTVNSSLLNLDRFESNLKAILISSQKKLVKIDYEFWRKTLNRYADSSEKFTMKIKILLSNLDSKLLDDTEMQPIVYGADGQCVTADCVLNKRALDEQFVKNRVPRSSDDQPETTTCGAKLQEVKILRGPRSRVGHTNEFFNSNELRDHAILAMLRNTKATQTKRSSVILRVGKPKGGINLISWGKKRQRQDDN